jgi:UDP-N-acetylglucosamine:LPS N-acetylglucosamine transferase
VSVTADPATGTAGPSSTSRVRVLVLSADVGEGHLAAALAIAEGLEAMDAEVDHRDGLRALGPVARHIIRDGYRFQLRHAPWSYTLMYRLFLSVRPARTVGAVLLSAAGRRRLARIVHRAQPDVVVSTHPALTAVLGRMRRRRRLGVPLVAPITDLADFAVWSNAGADVHLVMHQHAVAPVERVAGSGSATVVRPLVARRFLAAPDRDAAREALGLPVDGSLVAVSGGGWGVGDLGGGAETAIVAGADHVVVVAGRNEPAHRALERRFAGEPRVTVWGFTSQMDDLMRAADALVHSTGGVTSLEALSCGCPMIAYGTTVGHIRVHNATMAGLGLIARADTRAELLTELRARLGPSALPAPHLAGGADAAAIVAGASSRVLPLPRWRLAADRAVLPFMALAALYVGTATDDAYSLMAPSLEMRPLTHLAVGHGRVALVIRAPAGAAARLARQLAADGRHASFALRVRPSARLEAELRRLGDDVVPELPGPAPTRWLATRRALRHAPWSGHRRVYLMPAHGLSVGQFLLAQSAHAAPIAGQDRLLGSAAASAVLPAPGDIVVVTLDGGPAASSQLRTFGDRLAARGLRPEPVSAVPFSAPPASLSTSERKAGEASRTSAPATTTATPNAVAAT